MVYTGDVMPRIEHSILIHAPIETVYAIAKDNRSFPDFMEDVVSLTVVEESGNRVVSEWVGVISAFKVKVRWSQEDIWDDSNHTCVFKQIKGDYDEMSGKWTFVSEGPSATRFQSEVDYVYTVAGLGPLVGRVIHKLASDNIASFMSAIKGKAEKA